MIVRVRFRGPLASQITGDIEVTMMDASSLEEVLDKVLAEQPIVKEFWADSQQIDRESLLLKNEVDVGLLDGLKTIVENNDEIVVLPLVHGG